MKDGKPALTVEVQHDIVTAMRKMQPGTFGLEHAKNENRKEKNLNFYVLYLKNLSFEFIP